MSCLPEGPIVRQLRNERPTLASLKDLLTLLSLEMITILQSQCKYLLPFTISVVRPLHVASAESIPQPAIPLMSWTFTMRTGLRFADTLLVTSPSPLLLGHGKTSSEARYKHMVVEA